MARKRQPPVAAQAQPDLAAIIAQAVQAALGNASAPNASVNKQTAAASKPYTLPSGWAIVRDDDPRKPGTVGFRFMRPDGSTKARKSLAPENWALIRAFWGFIEPQIAGFPLPPEDK